MRREKRRVDIRVVRSISYAPQWARGATLGWLRPPQVFHPILRHPSEEIYDKPICEIGEKATQNTSVTL